MAKYQAGPGPIFLDEDPKDFTYILRALRNGEDIPTFVPKERIDNVISLRDRLQIPDIVFYVRSDINTFYYESQIARP